MAAIAVVDAQDTKPEVEGGGGVKRRPREQVQPEPTLQERLKGQAGAWLHDAALAMQTAQPGNQRS
jgi:hypothetical protein